MMTTGHQRGKETRIKLQQILGALAMATVPIVLLAAGPADAQGAKEAQRRHPHDGRHRLE